MSIETWLPPIRGQLEELCARFAIPLGVVIGWIQEESGGNPRETTSLREYGLFQIHPDESADMGFDHERIRVDQSYGISCGFALVSRYHSWSIAHLSAIGIELEDGCELQWRFAKLAHSMGFGACKTTMNLAGKMCSTWETFCAYCAEHEQALLHQTKHDPVKWIRLVNRVFSDGAPYGTESLWCPPVPPVAA